MSEAGVGSQGLESQQFVFPVLTCPFLQGLADGFPAREFRIGRAPPDRLADINKPVYFFRVGGGGAVKIRGAARR